VLRTIKCSPDKASKGGEGGFRMHGINEKCIHNPGLETFKEDLDHDERIWSSIKLDL
jgi:hypothetical protein